MLIKIFQGERALTKDNVFLDKFLLTDLPAATGGAPRIEVTFEIDAKSVLKVSAVEKISSSSEQLLVTCDVWGRWSKEEIDRMLEESEKHREEDEGEKYRLKPLWAAANDRKAAAPSLGGDERAQKEVEEGKLRPTCGSLLVLLDQEGISEKEDDCPTVDEID